MRITNTSTNTHTGTDTSTATRTQTSTLQTLSPGAFIVRIGFWDILCYLSQGTPQNSIDNYQGPYITQLLESLNPRP